MIDDTSSDVSSNKEAAESSVPDDLEELGDLWGVVINYTYGKMRGKLHIKKSELMQQDSELSLEDAVKLAYKTLKPSYEQQLL